MEDAVWRRQRTNIPIGDCGSVPDVVGDRSGLELDCGKWRRASRIAVYMEVRCESSGKCRTSSWNSINHKKRKLEAVNFAREMRSHLTADRRLVVIANSLVRTKITRRLEKPNCGKTAGDIPDFFNRWSVPACRSAPACRSVGASRATPAIRWVAFQSPSGR